MFPVSVVFAGFLQSSCPETTYFWQNKKLYGEGECRMNINNSQFLSIEQLQDQYLKQQKVNSGNKSSQGMSFEEILQKQQIQSEPIVLSESFVLSEPVVLSVFVLSEPLVLSVLSEPLVSPVFVLSEPSVLLVPSVLSVFPVLSESFVLSVSE